MKFKAGQTVWCSLVSQEVLIINPALNTNEDSDIELWCIEFQNGDRIEVSVNHLFDLGGTRQKREEKNPWKKFADNGDDPPADLSFGFSRFVIGKGKDGVKLPVVFDYQGATWHTPGVIEATEGDQGDLWREVEIVEWREL